MRHARAALLAVAPLLAAGCVTTEQKAAAVNDINYEFRMEYEGILLEKGTRTYNVPRGAAFVAMRGALTRIGMPIADESPEIGYLSARGAAPLPLDAPEWRVAADRDLPRARELLSRHVGPLANLFNFEPEGLDVVVNATALEVRGGTELSFTVRMRELAPPRSGIPRREYLPPSAVRMGLDKIWREVDRDLKDATWRR
jgi:hypothetical protein